MKINLEQQISMYNQYKSKAEIIIINLKNKLKDNELFINKNKNKINFNEEELNKKNKEVNKKKEVNNNLAFLEDKDNLIEEENKKFWLNKKLNKI